MSDLAELVDRINQLTPVQRLRLAADLLERGKTDLAKSIVDRVNIELGAAMVLSAERKSKGNGR